ncbi:MAG: hypothetical protein HYR64_07240 [Fimbriimonas ginsengisoli]|uniref:Lipoprotein n=1 Tax=Fimbriimonas ginsengisoli TaxID=1005039 RepID=A0A931PTY6_FIMGI|nr:hypothetical protein [Fimbriimonas ginsengisoli]
MKGFTILACLSAVVAVGCGRSTTQPATKETPNASQTSSAPGPGWSDAQGANKVAATAHDRPDAFDDAEKETADAAVNATDFTRPAHVTAAELGIPLYPGSKEATNRDGLSSKGRSHGKMFVESVRTTTATLEAVAAFYRAKLGDKYEEVGSIGVVTFRLESPRKVYVGISANYYERPYRTIQVFVEK